MKYLTPLILLLTATFIVYAGPNQVINLAPHYDKQHRLVTPDKILLANALKSYQDGFYKTALNSFMQSAAFGNSTAQKYIGLMNIKSIGVEQNWAKGFAWIRLSALDGSKKNSELKNSLYSQLTPQEKKQAEIEYNKISQDYGVAETLKRRDRWVKKQKRKATGSRTGSQTVNVVSVGSFGAVQDINRAGRLSEMENFVDNYNFGQVSGGEIMPVESKQK